MKYLAFIWLIFLSCQQGDKNSKAIEATLNTDKIPEFAMVIHGGAGTILKKNMSAEKEAQYRKALQDALAIGHKILSDGGSSTDAVIETIAFMEDSPLFNSGKGAVFTHDGKNALDASIMDGKTLNAGAISGVSNVKNPIKGALAVMKNSKHVFLSGKGAEEFCKKQSLDIVDPKYFFTQRRWDGLQKILAKEEATGFESHDNPDYKYGTVGAIALDKSGNIVAGTSTGGMTNKRFDRIGDSPIIGAGTYANNKTCGVSCTGHGEYFIRYAVAHDVSAMMAYGQKSLEEATNTIIHDKLMPAGGSGGLVALDHNGNVSMTFNTPGMYRGYTNNIETVVAIYKNE